MADLHSFEIQREITLTAPPAQVWAALTTQIDKWWAYRVGDRRASIQLDPRLGGWFEERWGDGEGVIWGQVVDLRHGKRLRLRGLLGTTGAGDNDYTYELEPRGDQTVLKLTHHGAGYTDPEMEQGYRRGWQELFEKHLKVWIEEGKTCDPVTPSGE